MEMCIRNAILFSQNKKEEVIFDDLLIKDGKIEKIGKIQKYKFEIDAHGKIILPGLINTHFHLGESIYYKLITPKTTEDYILLTEKIWNNLPVKRGIRKSVVKYSLLQLIKNGITCFMAARSWKEVEKSCLRAFLGYPFMLSKKLKNYSRSFQKKFVKIKKRYSTRKIKIGFWIHSLNFVNSKVLEMLSKWFEKFDDIFLTIHVNESKNERETTYAIYGEEPLKVLDSYGLLNEKVLLVHCNYLSKREIRLIRRRKAKISLNPISAYTLNNQLPPIFKLMEEKIPISLASDNLVVSKTFNLLRVCKFTSHLYKNKISYEKLIDLITINASECLNSQEMMGSIEEGKYADLIFFENTDRLNEKCEIIEWLINNYPMPSDVMVGGEFIMKNRKVIPFEEFKIKENYKKVKMYVKKHTK